MDYERAVAAITSMGFDAEMTVAAVEAAGGDVDAAVELLLQWGCDATSPSAHEDSASSSRARQLQEQEMRWAQVAAAVPPPEQDVPSHPPESVEQRTWAVRRTAEHYDGHDLSKRAPRDSIASAGSRAQSGAASTGGGAAAGGATTKSAKRNQKRAAKKRAQRLANQLDQPVLVWMRPGGTRMKTHAPTYAQNR